MADDIWLIRSVAFALTGFFSRQMTRYRKHSLQVAVRACVATRKKLHPTATAILCPLPFPTCLQHQTK